MAVDVVVRQAEAGWSSVQKILYVPHNEEEYERLVEVLDQLIDRVGEDEHHPLASLMEVIGVLIERYEDEYVPHITDL
jgi:HTH-type transcriptional regulator/antitoxin HigA